MEVPHLSPFFFFVMESLHISFNNILNSGLYKGIRIDESLTLSHLFYADDAVFIGKWDKANVITIVNMLKCFYLASGLKINIQKSKIMGIGTSQEEVDVAANVIGCNTFSSPFNYLGVKVGSSSSRSNFWDETSTGSSLRSSTWTTIVRECGNLSSKAVQGSHARIFFSLVLWPGTLLPNWLDGGSLIARTYSHTMIGLNGFTIFVSLKVLRIYWKGSFTLCGG
ncbi:RNA-directed DNA polymerase, eukaryota [Tanacetum coccineum]